MDRDQGCHDRCLEAFAGMVAVLAVSFKRVLLYDPIHPVFTLVSFDNRVSLNKTDLSLGLGRTPQLCLVTDLNRSASKVNLSKIVKVTHNEHKHQGQGCNSIDILGMSLIMF